MAIGTFIWQSAEGSLGQRGASPAKLQHSDFNKLSKLLYMRRMLPLVSMVRSGIHVL